MILAIFSKTIYPKMNTHPVPASMKEEVVPTVKWVAHNSHCNAECAG